MGRFQVEEKKSLPFSEKVSFGDFQMIIVKVLS
jgi:hypothetical protein